MTPDSILTIHRPDIWQRALGLATDLTAFEYRPKLDGAVCLLEQVDDRA
jgi:hypothetical protein